MKQLMFILAISAGIGCAVAFVQWQKVVQHREEISVLQSEAAAQARDAAAMQEERTKAEAQRKELAAQVELLNAQLQAKAEEPLKATPVAQPPQPAAAPSGQPDPTKGAMGKVLSGMMKEPEMRKFIQAQQRMILDQLYAPLAKQMGLTPTETEQFKELISENAMKAAEKSGELFSGSSSNRQAIVKTLQEEQKAQEKEIETFLGESRYEQYKQYQKTAAERMQLSAFKQQAGSENGLTDLQTEQLLAVIAEEKQSATANGALPSFGDEQNFQALTSETQGQKVLSAQESINARVYERARTILSPAQMEAYGKFQTNQLQVMRMSLSMARKMFATEGE